MKVWTELVVDIETGKVSRETFYEYSGPVALCDRALQQQATQAAKTATGTAAGYGAEAGGIQGNLVPRLESWAVNPPGYNPMDLAMMETGAGETAAANTGSAQQAMRLRAMRTGNVAGLGAGEAAAAGEGARASGSALQSILAKNAELKSRQQSEANRGLEGILGEDIRGQVANAGLVPEDINAGVNAGKVGWLQNMTQILDALKGAGGTSSSGAGFTV